MERVSKEDIDATIISPCMNSEKREDTGSEVREGKNDMISLDKDTRASTDTAETVSSEEKRDGLEEEPSIGEKLTQNGDRGFRLVECRPATLRLRVQNNPGGLTKDPHVKWAKTVDGKYIPVRSTTCLPGLDNRQRDKHRVESTLGLGEFGDEFTEFYLRPQDDSRAIMLARGYERVVYGDHGPYVEFLSRQIDWAGFPIRNAKPKHAFYDEHYTQCRTLMLYIQKRPVLNKKNPPPGEWSQANDRKEGYANYLSRRHYIEANPEKLIVVPLSMQHEWYQRQGHYTSWVDYEDWGEIAVGTQENTWTSTWTSTEDCMWRGTENDEECTSSWGRTMNNEEGGDGFMCPEGGDGLRNPGLCTEEGNEEHNGTREEYDYNHGIIPVTEYGQFQEFIPQSWQYEMEGGGS